MCCRLTAFSRRALCCSPSSSRERRVGRTRHPQNSAALHILLDEAAPFHKRSFGQIDASQPLRLERKKCTLHVLICHPSVPVKTEWALSRAHPAERPRVTCKFDSGCLFGINRNLFFVVYPFPSVPPPHPTPLPNTNKYIHHNTCVTSSLTCLSALAASRALSRSARPAESRKSFDTSHAASFKACIHSSRSANEGVACRRGEGCGRSRVGPRRTVAAGARPASAGGAGRGEQRM